MNTTIKDTGSTRIRKDRNNKLRERYEELWKQNLRAGVILDMLEEEFFISRPRIYGILNVREIQKLSRERITNH